MDLHERFRGCIIGLAVGDALGHPTEFISSVGRIKARFGERGAVDFHAAGPHPAGTFTDDTQMTVCVARALATHGHQPLDVLMTRLGDEFVAWARHPSNNRAPGGTCLAGCHFLEGGAAWRDAGVKGSKGCGAAMRAAPVGLFFFEDDDALVRVAAAQSVLTHSHPTGIASSVAAAAPVAWLARGNGIDGIVDYTRRMVLKVDEATLISLGAEPAAARALGVREQVAILDKLETVLDQDHEDVCALLGGAWIGEEAVATALWCFLKARGDFEEAVVRGANSSGDSDSIACIAGSFAGALHGTAGIPKRFDGVERRADLLALADELCAARAGDRPSLPARLDFFGAAARGSRVRSATAASDDGDDGAADDDGDANEGDDGEPRDDELVDRAGGDDDELSADELEREVTRHNELYWVYARPEISDERFDALCRRLKALRPASPALAHLGPAPDADKAVRHKRPMRSLDKCYEEADFIAWTNDFAGDVVAMPKVDGLACSLSYDEDGWLTLAATRGDGEVGENVTANARTIKGIPRKLAAGPVEVRGEVYLSLQRFNELKSEASELEGAPKNPRNLAAGALRQKDPNKTRAVGLSFLAYDLIGSTAQTQQQRLALLAGLGFPPIPQAIAPKHLAMLAVSELAKRRADQPYETDGVVVVVDDLAEHERLGATSHHPRYAIAWKFQGEEGQSVLRDVHWQVARTGTITPVAVVDPVELSGVTVTRATLHHLGFIDKLSLTLGAKLAMVRRGGVIPHVERVLEAGDNAVVIPAACPACGGGVRREGDFLMCASPQTCVAATIGRLIHWGKNTDIIGLGESVCEQLVERGLCRTPADLYALTRERLLGLDRLGPALADKLLAEIDKTRRLPLDVLLRALGIDGVGKTVARALAERFSTLPRLRQATHAELAAIRGLGEVSAGAIKAGLADNSALLEALLRHITLETEAQATGEGPLTGMSFVFTGALTIDRKAAEARVRALGAQTPSGVTKALTHLVVGGDRASPSTKQKAAEKLIADGAAIAVLDEAAFVALVASHEAAAPPAPSDVETPAPAEPSPAKKRQLTLF